ncbi:MAG TPA: cytochrome c maturation protein CcmE [Cytophagales bacterium]|nr:cytochrome c maturation protein CcmE [Cytophagales bacterium]
MKKTHIIGIGVIAIAIVIIISTAGDASTYVTFNEAAEMAQEGDNKSIHVVGKLPKTPNGQIKGIEESPDKLSFSFLLEDNNKKLEKVYYNNPIPADFVRSEQVVIIGSYKKDVFVADNILLKCPSKYEENKLSIK